MQKVPFNVMSDEVCSSGIKDQHGNPCVTRIKQNVVNRKGDNKKLECFKCSQKNKKRRKR